jgi:hypothetical protein
LYTPKLYPKKILAVPVMVLPLVLGFGAVALADNPPNSPLALPPDQIALTGTCLSVTQVTAAAQQAMSLYVTGDQPAGVIVNGNWMPAAMVANSEQYVNDCAGPLLPQGSSLRPADQITVNGCSSVTQVMTAAQDAISLYVPGDAPAGVIVNGDWVPAGIASTGGGAVASNVCS